MLWLDILLHCQVRTFFCFGSEPEAVNIEVANLTLLFPCRYASFVTSATFPRGRYESLFPTERYF